MIIKEEARKLFLSVENTEAVDRYSKAKKVFNNVTEWLISPDMREISDLALRDEKFNSEQMSDFEIFTRWERAFPFCAGMGESALYREELEAMGSSAPTLTLTDEDIRNRWKTLNDAIFASELQQNTGVENVVSINDFVSDFAKNRRTDTAEFGELVGSLKNSVKCIESNEVHILFDVSDMQYERPDIYHAGIRLERLRCDEKYSRDFVVCAQLIASVSGLLGDKKICLHLYSRSGYEAIQKLITYLSEHSAFEDNILLGVFADVSPDTLSYICGSYGSLTVYPELVLRPCDLGADLYSKLDKMFSGYPVGGMRFGGTLDCPIPKAAHRILKKELSAYLCSVCNIEADALFLAKSFFEN